MKEDAEQKDNLPAAPSPRRATGAECAKRRATSIHTVWLQVRRFSEQLYSRKEKEKKSIEDQIKSAARTGPRRGGRVVPVSSAYSLSPAVRLKKHISPPLRAYPYVCVCVSA